MHNKHEHAGQRIVQVQVVRPLSATYADPTMSDHAASTSIVPITDDLAADLLGDCDICDRPHVYAMVGSIAVCANEQCAAEALKDQS